jgi:hypothetical protein
VASPWCRRKCPAPLIVDVRIVDDRSSSLAGPNHNLWRPPCNAMVNVLKHAVTIRDCQRNFPAQSCVPAAADGPVEPASRRRHFLSTRQRVPSSCAHRSSENIRMNAGRTSADLDCRKCVTKSLTRSNQERISPLLRRGTGISILRFLRASGRFLTSWIERRDAWAAVRARDALDLSANASKGRLSLRKRRQPLRVCVWDPNVAHSRRSARTKPERQG